MNSCTIRGNGLVEEIGGLPGLEEHVRVLGGAPHDRCIRRHDPRPERQHVVGRDQRTRVLVREQGDLSISWDVRKPSKKWRNGTRERRPAAWATSAKSWASCTELAAGMAQPVVRACITSLWSPKI
jgi:hypothetical protein